jgi:hypothetical protein
VQYRFLVREPQRQSVQQQAADMLADARSQAVQALVGAAEWLRQVVDEAERVRAEADREARLILQRAREEADRISMQAGAAPSAAFPAGSRPAGSAFDAGDPPDGPTRQDNGRGGDEGHQAENRKGSGPADNRPLDEHGTPRRWWWVGPT